MKRYSILFVAGLALMAACQQPAEESFVQDPAEEPAVFEAYASSRIGTRSHFDGADEGTSKEGTLYWDETDKVGVMSIFWMDINNFDAPPFSSEWTAKFDAHVQDCGEGYDNNTYIGVPLTKYFQSDLATVEVNSEDANMARLYTTKPMSQWLMNIDEMVNIGLYDFAMIYPMSSAPVGLALCKDSTGDVIFGVPLRVEPEQLVSKKFGHYQICADSGIDAIRLFSGNLGCYNSEDLLHGTKVEYDDVNPLTSLLEFDIKSDSDTPVQISYLKIRTDDVPLAGDTYFASEGQSAFLIYSQWGEDGKSTSKEITLRFPEGTEITSSYSDEKYHAVVFPSYKAGVETVYNDGSVIGSAHCEYVQEYGGEILYFEAYDASDNLVLTAQKTIPENGFQARRRYKFSLDMTTGETPASAFSVSDPGEIPFEGKEWNATITSYKTDPVTGDIVPLAYTVRAFKDEACTQEIEMTASSTGSSVPGYSFPGILTINREDAESFVPGTLAQETVPIRLLGNTNVGQLSLNDAAASIRATLRAATPRGSLENPYNLSNASGAMTIQNTANCYIIGAPGYYCFPLVLGNGIKDGSANPDAYNWTGGTYPENMLVLERFHDYLNGEVDRPYVHNSSEVVRNSGHVPTSACILWEDAQNLIEADASSFALFAPVQDANGVWWTGFHIPAETIDQGNALIAVKDEEGTIMWSWHIWVTDYQPSWDINFVSADIDYSAVTEENPDAPISATDLEFKFMERNLGWVVTSSGSDTVFEPFEAFLLFVQEETGAEIKLRLYSAGKTVHSQMDEGYCPGFQWGRKDPLIPAAGSPKSGLFTDKQVWGLTNVGGMEKLFYGTESYPASSAGLTIQHPEAYFVSPAGNNYVMGLDVACNLWNTSAHSLEGMRVHLQEINKSIYDPSPVGYIIPPTAAYDALHGISLTGYFYDSFLIQMTGDVISQVRDHYGDRLCAANEYGVSYYTDKSHSGTIYFPSTNVRTAGLDGELMKRSDYEEWRGLFGNIPSDIVLSTSIYFSSDACNAVMSNVPSIMTPAFLQYYPVFSGWVWNISVENGASLRLVREAGVTNPANYNANAGSYIDDNSWN